MERFTVWLLTKLVQVVFVLGGCGLLGKATLALQKETGHKLRTGIVSLRQIQGQLQGQ